MPRVLLADKVADKAVEVLRSAGTEVLERPGLEPAELKEALGEVEGVICRSGAKLTAEALEGAGKLRAICRAGVGVDNIDIAAASRKGIVVMNTPGANTISTAEHTIALMLALARNIGPAYIAMREGRWERKRLTGDELCGATLGIIGLGRVGRAVAVRAAAFGMEVTGFDPFISRDAASRMGVELVEELDAMLGRCDYLTVHIPKSDETKGLIGREEIKRMKPGARIVNCARGEVVDMGAVTEAVEGGMLAGAAFDVYESEPPEDFSFARDDRILATPHLGASTEAAQTAVGVQAAEQMVEALENGTYRNALNITTVAPEEMRRLAPFCELARKLGRSAGMLNRGRVLSIELSCTGEVAKHNISPLEDHAILGVLQTIIGEEEVNIVSAPHLARERGIASAATGTQGQDAGFTNLLELRLRTDRGEMQVAGALLGARHQRIVKIDRYDTEVVPEGHLLLVFGRDRPGLIGTIGDTLGSKGVNIARMAFGREEAGGGALLALNLDSRCGADAIGEIEAAEAVERAVLVEL